MRTTEITQESLMKATLSFAVPFLLANFIQTLYGAVIPMATLISVMFALMYYAKGKWKSGILVNVSNRISS